MPYIREMTIADYESVIALMRDTPGIALRDADSREGTRRYLERNPGLSFVTEEEGRVVGCIMCGHDGRRGYLQHLIVHPHRRGQGLGRAMVARCLSGLEKLGISKAHVDVLAANERALRYWTDLGWRRRDDIHRFSVILSGGANA